MGLIFNYARMTYKLGAWW